MYINTISMTIDLKHIRINFSHGQDLVWNPVKMPISAEKIATRPTSLQVSTGQVITRCLGRSITELCHDVRDSIPCSPSPNGIYETYITFYNHCIFCYLLRGSQQSIPQGAIRETVIEFLSEDLDSRYHIIYTCTIYQIMIWQHNTPEKTQNTLYLHRNSNLSIKSFSQNEFLPK